MQLVSLCAFGLAGLLSIVVGIRYLLTRQFMPYHAAVLGKPWAALEPRLQAIIKGMLKVAGAGFVGCGCAILWLLLPLRRGEEWAVWATLTILITASGPILYVVLWLRRISPGARTPVIPTVAAMVLAVIGAAAFFASRN
jgi:hypothetical protein